jgi:hypothetical protein
VPDYAPTNYISDLNSIQIGAPVTYSFTRPNFERPTMLADVGLVSDYGQVLNFIDYRRTYNYPASSVIFGYSILSLDYTPNQAVPEPGTLALLTPAAIVFVRRHRSNRLSRN